MLFRKFYRRPIRDDIDTTQVGLPSTAQFKVKPIDDARATAAQPQFLKTWKELVAGK